MTSVSLPHNHVGIKSLTVRFVPGIAVLAIVTHSFAADWPGFRGSNVDAVSSERELFTRPGSFGLQVNWKKEIGSGYAGAAVAKGFVVTAFSDGTDDVVIALDEATGDEKWRFATDKTYEGHDDTN